jgi:hypothetical protein
MPAWRGADVAFGFVSRSDLAGASLAPTRGETLLPIRSGSDIPLLCQHPYNGVNAKVAELVDALVLGASGETRESSSLSFRTTFRDT